MTTTAKGHWRFLRGGLETRRGPYGLSHMLHLHHPMETLKGLIFETNCSTPWQCLKVHMDCPMTFPTAQLRITGEKRPGSPLKLTTRLLKAPGRWTAPLGPMRRTDGKTMLTLIS